MKTIRSIITDHLKGQKRFIQIGRSFNSAGVGSNTPIQITKGDLEPTLKGTPYLKTTFRNGKFNKILYTPSTLYVEVGQNWLLKQKIKEIS